MKSGFTLFVVIMGLFYAVGVGMLGYALWSAYRSRAAAGWATAPGTLTRCELESKRGDSDQLYEVKVEYTYAVGGREYAGSRLAFGYASSNGRQAHAQIYDALKEAKAVDVRYDPADPATSTLSYGVHRTIQFMLAFAFTWLAFTIGFSMIWWLSSRHDNVLLKNLVTH